LMDELNSRFDFVIIDAPPLLPVTDAAVIAQAAEGAVLIVRHGPTRREDLGRAGEILSQANARLLGTVITFTPTGRDTYGYNSRKPYGYGNRDPNRYARKHHSVSDGDASEGADHVVRRQADIEPSII
ncbi:MAG: capsular biosynthesis protein, partial [Pseudonocardiales bacterium]|nr:capsular biosynthesis protein [Pseudonocardiales bacterium]